MHGNCLVDTAKHISAIVHGNLPEGRFPLRGSRQVLAAGNGRGAIRACGSPQIGDSIRLGFLHLGLEKHLSGNSQTAAKNSAKVFSNFPRADPAGCTECAAVRVAVSQAVQRCVPNRHANRLSPRDESPERPAWSGRDECGAVREHREFRASRGIVVSAPWQTPRASSDSPALRILALAVMP